MDYSMMTVPELKAEIKKIEELIAVKTKETQSQLLSDLRKKCEVNGIDFNSLVASAQKPGKKKSQPKYRNPQDPNETWSGRGKKPAWIVAFLETGGELESLTL